MEKGKIRDTQISASSEWDSNHAAKLGRLNQKPAGKRIGAWAAGIPNAYQFLQIDLRIPMKITSVSTQGRNDNTNQWVTRYTIEYSLDGAHFKTFWSHGNVYVSGVKCPLLPWYHPTEQSSCTFSNIQPRLV